MIDMIALRLIRLWHLQFSTSMGIKSLLFVLDDACDIRFNIIACQKRLLFILVPLLINKTILLHASVGTAVSRKVV
jgi:hypothetical protein